jgi:predicted DNA-binding mobile mystery protein A
MPTRADTTWLLLRQLDAALETSPPARPPKPPVKGWISAVRHALGMSSLQLAERLGVTRSAVHALEAREPEGTTTLEALQRVANAMDCDLVYALVPRAGSFTQAVEARAGLMARRLTARAGHTMALESQLISADELQAQEKVLTRRLLAELPRNLWDRSWDG